MKPPLADVLSKTTKLYNDNIVTDLNANDQLHLYINNNKKLIKEFIIIICGFLVVLTIILFFVLLMVIFSNQETINLQQQQYESALLKNYDIRNRF
ncbi:ac108 [Oxyplax ochracea nucleopolyhedrovirus]|uniref:Ac108 n=1 Tax=Oxyplax ochracea nucleopolyhedrovirus TaxID=2083176 RepID=A0A2L0WU10_9ABAC|nr:ac108 [Oxyplax ochracea nucleopolyhedrovirus]AVA31136.1 ac108 [Oxyplax ochracea nucleopolyhedrovirus]